LRPSTGGAAQPYTEPLFFTLVTDSRGRAVAGVNDGLGRQGHQYVFDAAHQRVVISAQHVVPFNTLFMKRVTCKDNAGISNIKAHVPWRVPGRMEHL
jgi:hypothetical protein